MSYLDEFTKRSAKLLACQKEMIHYWFARGHTVTDLSKMFRVSRRTIEFILFPERKEENIKRRKERGGSKAYYKKEKNTQTIMAHRAYKKSI